jgi:predicted NAD/FAD-dependent oxidoreductase
MNATGTEASAFDAMRHSSVGVIGAGVSGLTAASLLTDHGLRVRVFDKARGVGGRTSVRRQGGLQFDHGAQYFTVQDERFRQRVTAWVDDGIVKEWDGHIVAIENGRIRPSQPRTRYVGVPAMNAIAKHLSHSLEVSTQTRVTAITRRGDQWLLQDDADRDLGSFDALIVALPAAQAADLLTGLPELAQQVSQCQLVPCWAVMLAFETGLNLPFEGAFVQNSPLTWIGRNSSKPGRPQTECWVLHASPAWSAEHIEDAPEAVCDQLLAELQQTVGARSLRPVHAAAHRWRYALPSEPRSVGCLWEETARVALCGDWCQAAEVEGAFLSGLKAAERIISVIGSPPTTEPAAAGAPRHRPN